MNQLKWNTTFFTSLALFVLLLIPLFSFAQDFGDIDSFNTGDMDSFGFGDFDSFGFGDADSFGFGDFDSFGFGDIGAFEDGEGAFDDNFQPFNDIPGNSPGPDTFVPGPDDNFPGSDDDDDDDGDDGDDSTPSRPSKVKGFSIFVNRIIIPNAYDSMPGDYISVYMSIENTGTKDLDDTKVILELPELNARDSEGPFDFRSGERKKLRFYVQLPEDTAPGIYTARLFVYNGATKRIIHREVEVTTNE